MCPQFVLVFSFPSGCSVTGSWGAQPGQQPSALPALWAALLRRQEMRLEGGAQSGQPLHWNPPRSFARWQQRQVSWEEPKSSRLQSYNLGPTVEIWITRKTFQSYNELSFNVCFAFSRISSRCVLTFVTAVLLSCWSLPRSSWRATTSSSVSTRAATIEVRANVSGF